MQYSYLNWLHSVFSHPVSATISNLTNTTQSLRNSTKLILLQIIEKIALQSKNMYIDSLFNMIFELNVFTPRFQIFPLILSHLPNVLAKHKRHKIGFTLSILKAHFPSQSKSKWHLFFYHCDITFDVRIYIKMGKYVGKCYYYIQDDHITQT